MLRYVGTTWGLLLLSVGLAWGQPTQVINGNRVHAGWVNMGTTTGTATAYLLDFTPNMPGYVTGQCFLWNPHVANTGAATLNVDGLGAKPFKKWSGTALVDLVANDFAVGRLVLGCYDGTNIQVMSFDVTTPATGGHTLQDEGSALPARLNLNFVGGGIACVDNAGTNATVCTVAPTGGGATDFADLTGQATTAQIADNAITLPKMADMPTGTVMARLAAGTGDPEQTPLQNLWDLPKELNNTRVTPRTLTHSDTTPIVVNADSYDVIKVPELSQATTISIPSGTVRRDQQNLEILIFTTTARTLTFTTGTNGFANEYGIPLPTVSKAGAWVRHLFTWNTTTSKWGFNGSTQLTELGYKNLPISGFKMPVTGVVAVPDRSEARDRLLFDANQVECAYWEFVMPGDYVGSLAARLPYSMTSGSSGSVEFNIRIWATTPGDTGDVSALSFDAPNPCDDAAVPGVAGRLDIITCSLPNTDTLAAGDVVTVELCNDTNDSATGDREVRGFELSYRR